LKRREAINLLYKIYNACQDITINAIQIEALEKKDVNSNQDFILVIRASLIPLSQSIVRTIAKNHEFEVLKIDQKIIITSPKKIM
jgi:hypothetical protein